LKLPNQYIRLRGQTGLKKEGTMIDNEDINNTQFIPIDRENREFKEVKLSKPEPQKRYKMKNGRLVRVFPGYVKILIASGVFLLLAGAGFILWGYFA